MAGKRKFGLALAGGTFDRLHKGHEAFLRAAFGVSKTVWIGLTSDSFAKRKERGSKVENYKKRKAGLEEFLRKGRLLSRCRIMKIRGVAGPQAANKGIGAIMATEETLAGARHINALRRMAKVRPAKIVLVDFVLAQDGKRISSTRVRQGTISRTGKVYLRKFEKPSLLPGRLVKILRKPIGILFADGDIEAAAKKAWDRAKKSRPSLVATVGDECYRQFKRMGVTPDISVIDGKIRRKAVPLPPEARNAAKVANRRGTISSSLVRLIGRTCAQVAGNGKPKMIFVRGEEDLAALPAILALPLGSVLFYGMPGEGVVMADVDEGMKERAFRLFAKFEGNR